MKNDDKSLKLILRDRIAKSELKLYQDLKNIGYGSGERHLVSFDEFDRMMSVWKLKVNQLERINSLIDPDVISRSELLKSWKTRDDRRRNSNKMRNKRRKDKKAKCQDYKRYKEHCEAITKNRDPISWALETVDHFYTRTWLLRRLSAVVIDGSIYESQLVSVFKQVGGSDKYYDGVKSRLKIIEDPKLTLPDGLAIIWTNATGKEKILICEELSLSRDQVVELQILAKQIRAKLN